MPRTAQLIVLAGCWLGGRQSELSRKRPPQTGRGRCVQWRPLGDGRQTGWLLHFTIGLSGAVVYYAIFAAIGHSGWWLRNARDLHGAIEVFRMTIPEGRERASHRSPSTRRDTPTPPSDRSRHQRQGARDLHGPLLSHDHLRPLRPPNARERGRASRPARRLPPSREKPGVLGLTTSCVCVRGSGVASDWLST